MAMASCSNISCLFLWQVVFGVSNFVSANLGQKFVESPEVGLAMLYDNMTTVTPLVFVLSTGTDPMGNFLR